MLLFGNWNSIGAIEFPLQLFPHAQFGEEGLGQTRISFKETGNLNKNLSCLVGINTSSESEMLSKVIQFFCWVCS